MDMHIIVATDGASESK